MARTPLVVLTTVGSEADARALVTALLADRLIACGTFLQSARPIYRWEGQVREEGEAVVLLTTEQSRGDALCAAERARHAHAVPQLVALPGRSRGGRNCARGRAAGRARGSPPLRGANGRGWSPLPQHRATPSSAWACSCPAVGCGAKPWRSYGGPPRPTPGAPPPGHIPAGGSNVWVTAPAPPGAMSGPWGSYPAKPRGSS